MGVESRELGCTAATVRRGVGVSGLIWSGGALRIGDVGIMAVCSCSCCGMTAKGVPAGAGDGDRREEMGMVTSTLAPGRGLAMGPKAMVPESVR